MVKKIGLVLFLFLFACTVIGEPDIGVKVEWDANTELDMKEYVVYVWQGQDTTVATPIQVGTVVHDFLSFTYQFPIVFKEPYIRAGIVAVDTSGNLSGMGLTRFYTYEELSGPATPTNIRIVR